REDQAGAEEDDQDDESQPGTGEHRAQMTGRTTSRRRDRDRDRERERSAQSTASRTTISTQPVVVRTYSGSKSRHSSRLRSEGAEPATMSSSEPRARRHVAQPDAKLPSVDEFKFNHLLLTVEPDINSAIDAIAEICARSRYSLADEYAAHLPPFTQTLPPMPRTRGQMHAQRNLTQLGKPDGQPPTALTTVPETSSSSEHSSPSTNSGSGRTGGSAYGSLTKVLRRSGSARHALPEDAAESQSRPEITRATPPLIGERSISQPQLTRAASPRISTDIETTIIMSTTVLKGREADRPEDRPKRSHQRSHSWFARAPAGSALDARARLVDVLRNPAPG
ncbi:MAG: hypothetical protein INR71_02430, partial [Terriglobus roseus]|nr:hypothetical protein [Terriglobus roseus]